MLSTPAAITTSYAPAITPCAAKVRRLLRRPALTIDRGADHRVGEPGGERGVPADVDGLVADLHDATHDDVVDDRRVEVVASDQRLQRVRGEVDGMPVLELPVPAAEGVRRRRR